MKKKLRIILDGSRSAKFNMAADNFLYNSNKKDLGSVTLRIYSWGQPTVTIGYMQNSNNLNHEALFSDNIKWIRRATGGRAVLHNGDVTYSITFPKDCSELGKTINESYRIISKALKRSFEILGVETQSADSNIGIRSSRQAIKLPCFLTPAREEILLNGKKLIGSAQKRGSFSVLQHGSIPLNSSYCNIVDYLNITEEQKKNQRILLEDNSVALNEKIPDISVKHVEDALIQGFSEKLDFLDIERKGWNKTEISDIENIIQSDKFKKKWCC